jgi:hypothetical protein
MKGLVTRGMLDAGIEALVEACADGPDLLVTAIFAEERARETLTKIYRAMENASDGPKSPY